MKKNSTLTKYHQKRNEKALKAAKEQSKKRYTSEEMKTVIHKSLYEDLGGWGDFLIQLCYS